MKKVVKIVYSSMYQKDASVTFREKVLVTVLTISILSLVISIGIIELI